MNPGPTDIWWSLKSVQCLIRRRRRPRPHGPSACSLLPPPGALSRGWGLLQADSCSTAKAYRSGQACATGNWRAANSLLRVPPSRVMSAVHCLSLFISEGALYLLIGLAQYPRFWLDPARPALGTRLRGNLEFKFLVHVLGYVRGPAAPGFPAGSVSRGAGPGTSRLGGAVDAAARRQPRC